MRRLPAVSPQLQSGAVQFGEDLPGIFIRGDEALELAEFLDLVVSGTVADKAAMVRLRQLSEFLEQCGVPE